MEMDITGKSSPPSVCASPPLSERFCKTTSIPFADAFKVITTCLKIVSIFVFIKGKLQHWLLPNYKISALLFKKQTWCDVCKGTKHPEKWFCLKGRWFCLKGRWFCLKGRWFCLKGKLFCRKFSHFRQYKKKLCTFLQNFADSTKYFLSKWMPSLPLDWHLEFSIKHVRLHQQDDPDCGVSNLADMWPHDPPPRSWYERMIIIILGDRLEGVDHGVPVSSQSHAE